jgi:hypothetical protein
MDDGNTGDNNHYCGTNEEHLVLRQQTALVVETIRK